MSLSIYKDGELKTVAGDAYSSVPMLNATFPGQITMGANVTPPTGWLKCDGGEYDTTTYSDLYSAIGTLYNKADTPAGKFCVPDLRGKYAMGVEPTTGIGTNIEESIPNIKGKLWTRRADNYEVWAVQDPIGAFVYGEKTEGGTFVAGDVSQKGRRIYLDASQTSSGNGDAYKDGAKVRPDSVALSFFIKY